MPIFTGILERGGEAVRSRTSILQEARDLAIRVLVRGPDGETRDYETDFDADAFVPLLPILGILDPDFDPGMVSNPESGHMERPSGLPIEIKICRIPGPVHAYTVLAGTTVAEALLLAGILLDPGETVRTDAGNVGLKDSLDEARSLFVLQAVGAVTFGTTETRRETP